MTAQRINPRVAPDEPAPDIPAVRLFKRQRPALSESPVLRAMLEDFVSRSDKALTKLCAVKTDLKLSLVEHGPPEPLLSPVAAVADIIGRIPEWNAPGGLRIDHRVLFFVLETMFGGDRNSMIDIPQRPLTGLERSLAETLASALVAELQASIAGMCRFSFRDIHLAESPLGPALGKAKEDYLTIALDAAGIGNAFIVALPASLFSQVDTKPATSQTRESLGHDPLWSAAFNRKVGSCDLTLVAAVSGPPMALADVAGLTPGTVLELDASALESVRLECDEHLLYLGRLGQSRDHFTVRIERLGTDGA